MVGLIVSVAMTGLSGATVTKKALTGKRRHGLLLEEKQTQGKLQGETITSPSTQEMAVPQTENGNNENGDNKDGKTTTQDDWHG